MDRPTKLIQAFQKFDTDNTGRVSVKAMETILTTLGNKPLTRDEIHEFTADGDEGDGTIDYRKFVNTVIFGC